jgi:hypothetical protein
VPLVEVVELVLMVELEELVHTLHILTGLPVELVVLQEEPEPIA